MEEEMSEVFTTNLSFNEEAWECAQEMMKRDRFRSMRGLTAAAFRLLRRLLLLQKEGYELIFVKDSRTLLFDLGIGEVESKDYSQSSHSHRHRVKLIFSVKAFKQFAELQDLARIYDDAKLARKSLHVYETARRVILADWRLCKRKNGTVEWVRLAILKSS
jgi:glutaredoxin-related protein